MTTRSMAPTSPHAGLLLFSDFYRRDSSYTNWRPDGSGDCLLIYTESGAGKFVTSAGPTVTRQGDVVLYGPGEMQDYSTLPQVGKWNLLWVHFSPKTHWQIWLNWPVNERKLKLLQLRGEPRRHFRRAMRATIYLSRLPIPQAQDLAANALEEALIWAHVSVANKKWLTLDARVRKATDFLITHFRQPFQMETLARHCGLSASRLAHLFKQQLQTTPQQFWETQRMQLACTLLRITGRSVAQIAAEVGYTDFFYFTNRFHKYTGKSPTSFRGTLLKKANSRVI